MRIQEFIDVLEAYAPPAYQEDFDNAGLLVGDAARECTGVLVTHDATEAVIEEAAANGCNLVVAYHPILFKGLRRITGKTYVERVVTKAIKGDISIYAIHTNLDNIKDGMNSRIAACLGLQDLAPLEPKKGQLKKLYVFVPKDHAGKVRQAIFDAGGGHIGRYDACSFNTEGTGTYRAGEGAEPFIGQIGEFHKEPEIRIEIIFPAPAERSILEAMVKAHPYEEVAYDLVTLDNAHQGLGNGWIGTLPEPMGEEAFLHLLKDAFHLSVVRHSPLRAKPVRKVAVCGGAGSFLTGKAIGAGADWLVTADLKYHEFFAAEDRIVLADIGHFESEQYTPGLLYDILREKFRTFAIFISKVRTNPVHYFL
ncbi:Nif3-like dinuclear metal center hexameric protein [Dinghuibacter silviterrae]|uniref:GTP cyclohydrolase 1 type 2 homolog n=1 Tax=Dinghuibacter silviterrae TaxID=1539049 RepID=A0A4V3GLQ1_9BACT|nr:Nif3-like dinuclear metal center hexameric protein [Dinghuibacter silviterrae]TDX00413.1 dinuclear metal center YbgI/SA1388 family protein [Dinghuibacter silviterrae]